MARPDTVLVQVGVEGRAPTLVEATADVTRRATDVIARVKAFGVDEKDVTTVSYLIEPLSAPRRSEADVARIVGYRVANVVELRIRDLARAGAIIDAAVVAGANTVSSLRFTVADPVRAEAEARALAVRAAATKARQLAEAAGVRLGEVVSVAEGATVRPVFERFARPAVAMAGSAPGPVEPGQLEVSVSVEVHYRIER
jgi:hypothetical protein